MAIVIGDQNNSEFSNGSNLFLVIVPMYIDLGDER